MSNWLMEHYKNEKFGSENFKYETKVRGQTTPRLKFLEGNNYTYESVNSQDLIDSENYVSYKTLIEQGQGSKFLPTDESCVYNDMSFIDLKSKSRTLSNLVDKKSKEFIAKNDKKLLKLKKEADAIKQEANVSNGDTNGTTTKE